MSTSKHFDKICCVVLAVVLVITALFVNGEKLGLTVLSRAAEYESKIFDTSYVHTINIVMDDWDSFIDSCTNEEYQLCSVVIDNEAVKNVAIRAKGNTSLSQVASYGNDRYSFKIEFDAYDSTKNYYGLDKLCLNNIIQDNTYMKDYLVYTMMNEYGVNAPLCSYVYVTVNGEDWGLYLAVEGVEDAFLERNYGNEDVNLYKPDSISMGGGKGNGKAFDMDDFNEKFGNSESTTDEAVTEAQGSSENTQTTESTGNNPFENSGGGMPNMPNGNSNGEMPTMPEGGFDSSNMPSMPNGGFGGNMPQGGDFNGEMPTMPEGGFDSGNMPSFGDNTQESGSSDGESNSTDSENSTDKKSFGNSGNFGGGGNMGGGMGSDDVKLIYSDDSYDSYSNIFDNAKTKIGNADKNRLIASLKNLNENTDIENTVDVDEVIRYFVVHNFVLNFDSYTGSMIHNYYLTENEGQLSMIPWDYNLAFGGFQSMSDAATLVNFPIDSPVSGGTTDSRPMLAWIFNSEEYTEQYHEMFSNFISSYFDSGEFEAEIDRVKEMISPYVEKDPTKFCTYDEFVKGIDTLKEFCLLRAESVKLQLDGTIGSTSETQTEKKNFVSADNITISDMGSMGNTMGGGGGAGGGFGGKGENGNEATDSEGNENAPTPPSNNGDGSQTPPENSDGGNTPPSNGSGQTPPSQNNGETTTQTNSNLASA